MLCINPARRISALDALAHAYFKNDDGDGGDGEEEEEEEEEEFQLLYKLGKVIGIGAYEMYHINIVKLLDVISNTKNEWYIIFEYLDLDLEKYMYIMHQILSGVMYCHKHRIMHQDLTPDNLLIDLNASVVKIADFGMARAFDFPLRAYSPEVVTIWYKAPEILLGSPVYSTAIDVWSVGCIFAKMLMRQNLFAGASKNEHIRKIFSIMGTPNERTWPGVTSLPYYPAGLPEYYPENLEEFFPDLEPAGVDLLSEMLCMNPTRRISARRALGHAYFKKKKRKEKKEKKVTILDPIEEEEEEDDDDP
ncbi:unnamed protein product [Camellia sinensis]